MSPALLPVPAHPVRRAGTRYQRRSFNGASTTIVLASTASFGTCAHVGLLVRSVGQRGLRFRSEQIHLSWGSTSACAPDLGWRVRSLQEKKRRVAERASEGARQVSTTMHWCSRHPPGPGGGRLHISSRSGSPTACVRSLGGFDHQGPCRRSPVRGLSRSGSGA